PEDALPDLTRRRSRRSFGTAAEAPATPRRTARSRRSLVEPEQPAVLEERLAVDGHAPAVAQVAHQVPVDRALVAPARVGVRAPQRQVHGAEDLLVEQRLERRHADVGVRADPDLAEVARALVGGEHAVE